MKRSFLEDYAEAVVSWDKTHRIVGKTPINTLIKESLCALRGMQAPRPSALIDVGAGAGIVGIPWLSMDREHRSVFVESDQKKTAFLRYYLSSQKELCGRWLVLGDRLEKVSRETIVSFLGDENFFSVARAFSGSRTLGECLKDSELCRDKFYIFTQDDSLSPPYVLKIFSI